ncbi:MAG: hypothetical protein KA230_07815 [Flavobacteriales bacterium]|nr:hypothetical protein [Flavobacteriales bacterium]
MITNWDATRWLRLVLAIIFLIAGISQQEPVAYVAAAFFGVQALFNVGCCGASCASTHTPDPRTTNIPTREVIYEEVK